MSKWLVLVMDIFIVGISFVFSTAILFNFDLTYIDPQLFKYHLLLVTILRLSSFIYLKTYTGIIRHTSVEDGKLLFKSVVLSSTELVIITVINFGVYSKFTTIPYSLFPIGYRFFHSFIWPNF